MQIRLSGCVRALRASVFALGVSAAWLSTSWAAETIAPGVTFTTYNLSGPNKAFVVAADRYRSEYTLEVGWSQGKRNYTARQPVSQIAGNYDTPPARDVLSAINGSYFDGTTAPRLIGIGQSTGEMLDTPSFSTDYTYHTFMVGPTRLPTVATNFDHAQGTITFADSFSMPLTQYNFYMSGPLTPINGVTAFTPGFDSSTRSNFSVSPSMAVEVVLSNVSYPMRSDKEVAGTITAINTPTSGNASIPAGGMVLTAWGSTKSTIVAHAHLGDRLRVRASSGSELYNNSDNALTGIGWIVHNGVAYTPGWANLESGAAPYSRNPRSIVAWNDDYWYQVVIDGRSSTSVGMTFQEAADFMIGTLNAHEAVNYDGGGSATMVVNGTVRNVPSDGSERYVANAIMLVKRDNAATSFPLVDAFPSTGRNAAWDDKFHYNGVAAFSPASPSGDGYVLKVLNPDGGVETTRRGNLEDANYFVRADIYCEYRPADAADGTELYGLFARDSGTGALSLSTYGGGNCYALLYDAHDGRVMPGKFINGTFTEFAPSPIYLTSTAWRQFRIDCQGTSIRYYVDSTPVAEVADTTFARGYYGIAYKGAYTTAANMHGTRADNFYVDQLGATPGKAVNPSPANGTAITPFATTLSWTAGANALSHDVHFGTTTPGDPRGNQTATTFDTGPLVPGQTYYWRIDEVNENGSTIGDVWTFRTQYYRGDMDNDRDVDQEDFGAMQVCFTDVGIAQTDPACIRARIDADTDVDFDDATLFLQCLHGPGTTPPLSCLTNP